MQAVDFLAALFDPVRRDAGTIELRRLRNGTAECVGRKFTLNPIIIRDTISRWNSPNEGTGAYFGVAMRHPSATSGKKTDISVIPALWFDLDTAKMGWSDQLTIGALKSMHMRPSAIVHSGNGLHVYYALDNPVYLPDDSTRTKVIMRVEDAMRKIGHVIGSDRTFDITRVLRLPGTENTKGDKPKPVKVVYANWDEYSLEQLEQLAATTDTLLENGIWLSKEQMADRAKAIKERNRLAGLATDAAGLPQRRMTINQIWEHTRYGGGERGSAFMGLDEAMTRAIAVTWAQFAFKGDDWTIDSVLSEIKHIKQRDAPNEIWNDELERRKAQDKLDRFKEKWQDVEIKNVKARGKRVRAGSRGE